MTPSHPGSARVLRLPGLLVLVVGCAFVLGVVAPRVHAEPSLEILASEAIVRFPQAITFRLSARSSAPIQTVNLEFSTPQARYTDYERRIRVLDTAGMELDVSWTWRVGSPNLPPGAEVRFRWLLETADREVHRTELQSVRFEDGRYAWRVVEGPGVRIAHYQQDDALGPHLLGLAQAALARIGQEMGLVPTGTISFYVYDSQDALRGALAFSPVWIGGIAFPEFDTILVAIPPNSAPWAERAIPHELSHQITYQLTFNPSLGSNLPPWLNEGLAVLAEQSEDQELTALFQQAVEADSLPTLRGLSASFPEEPHLAGIDYAASRSVTSHLVTAHGPEKIRQLLAQFKKGKTTDEALTAVYGFNQDGLESRWRAALGLPSHDRSPTPSIAAQPTLPPTSLERPSTEQPAGGFDRRVLTALGVAAAVGALLLMTFAVSSVLRRG